MQIEENIPLAPLTTLRLGGPARLLATVQDEAELLEAVNFATGKGLPVFVLGGGSNLVVADTGFKGVVLRMALNQAATIKEQATSVLYTVSAGMDWDAFVLEVCTRELSGIECLAGIPGLVGGTPVQNVGAYGQEVSDTIVSLRALDLTTRQFTTLDADACGFGYRRSLFNSIARGRYIVTSVTFRFEVGRLPELKYAELKTHFDDRTPTPMEVYRAVRAIRHGKGMLLVEGEADGRSAGSFFKNPVVDEALFEKIASHLGVSGAGVPHWPAGEGRVKLAAAWLLEQAGFSKGFVLGRVGISSRHTLALVNRGGATAAELLALRDLVRHRVTERFGIELEQEPVMLGDF